MQDVSFELDSITLRAKRWGVEGGEPILALHGWLDNAGSFDFIAPYFQKTDFVALDLAGHGKSDHRGTFGTYNIWQDVSEILAIAKSLKWSKFTLVGHSRGAMIAMVLAGAFPKKVNRLGLIESFLPPTTEDDDAPGQLAAAIEGVFKLSRRKRNYYKTLEAAAHARAKGFFEIPLADAKALAERGVMRDSQGAYWGNDPLLMAPSEVRFTPAQVRAFLDRIEAPMAVVVAEEGVLNNNALLKHAIENKDNITTSVLTGGHHLHMSQCHREVAEFLIPHLL